MGSLSDSLRDMGFTPTGEESPVDEDGILWSNGLELVCDETGTVIDGDHHPTTEKDAVYRYRHSDKVKLYGGYVSAYDWGDDGDQFRY